MQTIFFAADTFRNRIGQRHLGKFGHQVLTREAKVTFDETSNQTCLQFVGSNTHDGGSFAEGRMQNDGIATWIAQRAKAQGWYATEAEAEIAAKAEKCARELGYVKFG
jgi:hypothetical protein